MTNTVRYPLTLGCVCLAVGLGLALTYKATKGPMDARAETKIADAIATAFFNVQFRTGAPNPWDAYDTATVDGREVYVGYRTEQKETLHGYATLGEAQGYSSRIKVIAGIEPAAAWTPQAPEYRILGVRIVNQQETPGLGALVDQTFTSETVWSLLLGSEAEADPQALLMTDAARATYGDAANRLGPRPAFQDQFAGRTVTVSDDGAVSGLNLLMSGWSEVKAGERLPGGVAAITGATISSMATLDAVKDAVRTIHNAIETDAVPTPGDVPVSQ
jgi:Na+-translocating ferredoxin:NAD+ oxidoreductase RnfG subunit